MFVPITSVFRVDVLATVVRRDLEALEDFSLPECQLTSTNIGNVADIWRMVDGLATKTSITIALAFNRLPPAALLAAVLATTAEPQSTALRLPRPGMLTVLP